MTQDLLYEVREGTAFMTINRESRRNAISQEMITSFMDYMDQAEKDEGVRAACVTAVGEKAFCSGADLGGTLTTEGSDRLAGPRNHAELLKRFARFGRPVVARVNGPCLAGGLGLMLSCDIAIARDDVFFCTPEVNVGIFPMMVGALIYRNVSRKKAVEMVLPGRKIPAPEAEQMGLTTRAVEPGRLDEEVHKTLVLLKSKSPLGMKIGKDAFRIMSDMPFDEGVDYLSEALVRIMATEDAAEGMKAFLEKRTPDFKGR